jgi:translation initiation factor IF-2
MSKVRVHDLAKELGLSSKEAVEKLIALGIPVKSHSSTVDDEQAARLRAAAGGASAKTSTEAPAKAAEPEIPEVVDLTEPAREVGGEEVHLPRGITVGEFAGKMGVGPNEVIKMLLSLGEMKTITQSLSGDAIELLAHELGRKVVVISPEEAEGEAAGAEEEDESLLEPRAPVVTVMGHVDHGKSSILEQFRKKEMLSLEAGGITQAIGAYQVHTNGRVVTFIDTPGHEAFTQMRARGAQVTDLAILVVAADDGVQPQTVEALDHARAAGVPVIVAVNKIDKPEADPTRVRQQLSEMGLTPEEWGGEAVFVDVSAKQGTNLDQLLEMINLVADLQELRANPQARGRGVAIEAHLDKGRGPVATLLVQKGTLRIGDPVVCGSAWCRVRAMVDEAGHSLKEASPSQPVQVTGWSRVPAAGDDFRTVADDREAKHTAQEREAKQRQADFVAAAKPLSLEDLLTKTRAGEFPELKVILKADTQGSLEALVDSLEKMDHSMVRTTALRKGVGAITENDVTLAQASGAIVLGFNVRPDASARQLAEKEGVDVRTYQIIYQLLTDIEQATKGLLAPLEEEVVLGSAEVRATFKVPKGVVAGCYVTEGRVTRGARARLIREGAIIYTGTVGSLRRFKDDAKEVASGFECGLTLEGYMDVKEGDVVEAFEVREVARV